MDIRYEKVGKTFDKLPVLIDFDLLVPDGTFTALLGPSGCGKTTALRMLAGLDQPTVGRVFLGDRDVTNLPPRGRDIAMVFQSYALYPHLKVSDNIAYPLRIRKVPKDRIRTEVEKVAASLGLTELLDRKPRQLSGGERQRVALARAIIRQPAAFLMDEPLSNLDAQLRIQMRTEIKRLQKELAVTTLYVTHDQVEAMTMADRVAIMRKGRLQQLATPSELYGRPANTFVARFVGSPPMNILSGSIGDGVFRTEGASLAVGPSAPSGDVELGFRPEGASIVGPDEPDVIPLRVYTVEPLGNESIVSFAIGHQVILVRAPADVRIAMGDACGLRIPPRNLHFFNPADGGRIAYEQISADRIDTPGQSCTGGGVTVANDPLDSVRWSRRQLLKVAGLGAVAAAAAPIIAACSSTTSSAAPSGSAAASGAASSAPSAGGKINVGSFQDPALNPLKNTFFKQFQDETGIEVVYNETSYDAWYEAAKRDGLNKTGAYDIYIMDDNWVPEFAAGGIVQSLDKLGFKPNPDIIEKGLEQGYWPPKSGPRMKLFKDANPELYALVIIDDTNLFYYNTDYFQVAPATWDDLEAVIKAKAAPPNLYGFAVRGAKGNPAVMTFLPFLNSYGGNFVNDDWTSGLNSPEAIAAFTRELSWTPYMSTSTPAFDTADMTGLLLQGKTLAITDYTGTAVTAIDDPTQSKVVGKIGTTNTPKQVKNGPAIGTFIAGVASGAPNTDGALAFLDWFTSDKVQLAFAQGGSAAVTQKALTDPSSASKYRWLPAIAESVATSTPKPRTPDEPKFEDILGTQINIALSKAIAQKSGFDQIAKEALTTAADQMNALVQQNKDIYF